MHDRGAEHVERTQVMLRSHVERCLQQVWQASDLEVDADGDYPYRFDSAACWVTLIGGPVPGVRVMAHAAHGLKSSAKLLREINDLNGSTRWVRVVFSEGLVWVTGELHWSAVDRMALEHLMRSVGSVASDIGPLFAAVYGGSTPFPAPEGARDHDGEDEEAG